MFNFQKKSIIRLFFILTIGIQQSFALNYEAFTKYVEKALAEWGTVGAAIAIVHDGKVEYIKTFGVRTLGENKPVTEDTLFKIVSLTKNFTALLMVRLHEENIVDLNKTVISYLPDFKLNNEKTTKEMKIIDLLSHNSGLPEFAFDSLVETDWSPTEIYNVLDQIPSKAELGTTFAYQNIFPGIAGMIAQKETGKPLSTLYQEKIFDPLGFEDTIIGEKGLTGDEGLWKRFKARVKNCFRKVVGEHYLTEDGKPYLIKNGNPSTFIFPSSRGVEASIRDMAKWLQFWLTGLDANGKPLLGKEVSDIFFQKRVDIALRGGTLFPKDRITNIYYGVGWYVHDYGPLKAVYSHMGGMVGTRGLIVIAPEKKYAMVVMLNVGGMRVSLLPEALRSKFLDMITDLEPDRDWSKELLDSSKAYHEKQNKEMAQERLDNPTRSSELETYAGTYKNKLYGEVKIIKEKKPEGSGERLVLNYRKLSAALTHFNGDIFTYNPAEFSPAYSVTDTGIVVFTYNPETKKIMLEVSSLREGEDKRFIKE